MMKTTIPSFIIAAAVFLIVSLCHDSGTQVTAAEFAADLSGSFRITPWLMVTPLVTAFMISKKIPAILTLFVATLMGVVTALLFQPQIIWHIVTGLPVTGFSSLSFAQAFKGCMLSVYGPTSISVGNPELDSLIATNGITGMLPTVFLVMAASAFGVTVNSIISFLPYVPSDFALSDTKFALKSKPVTEMLLSLSLIVGLSGDCSLTAHSVPFAAVASCV